MSADLSNSGSITNGVTSGVTSGITNSLDVRALADVRRAAASGDAGANKKVAQQFEALFLSVMLKNMRQAGTQDGATESEQTRMARSMYDQQLTQNLAGKGLGLADAILRQLDVQQVKPAESTGTAPIAIRQAVQGTAHAIVQPQVQLQGQAQGLRQGQGQGQGPAHAETRLSLRRAAEVTAFYSLDAEAERASAQDAIDAASGVSLQAMSAIPGTAAAVTAPRAALPVAVAGTDPASAVIPASMPSAQTAATDPTQQFVDKYRDAARSASAASGIPTRMILGQAALESGWGKHEVRDARGQGSFNLFGIKATAGWTGKTVDAVTTEVINGVSQKVVQKFRAYASYAESFMDYAKTVAGNPRYTRALAVAHDPHQFAQEMGRSGYATDPAYGSKLARVLTGPLNRTV